MKNVWWKWKDWIKYLQQTLWRHTFAIQNSVTRSIFHFSRPGAKKKDNQKADTHKSCSMAEKCNNTGKDFHFSTSVTFRPANTSLPLLQNGFSSFFLLLSSPWKNFPAHLQFSPINFPMLYLLWSARSKKWEAHFSILYASHIFFASNFSSGDRIEELILHGF